MQVHSVHNTRLKDWRKGQVHLGLEATAIRLGDLLLLLSLCCLQSGALLSVLWTMHWQVVLTAQPTVRQRWRLL